MEIIRNVAGMELKITLTEEELRSIVAEFATITFNGTKTKTEPEMHPISRKLEPEPKKFTMPKTTHVGRMTDHMTEVKEMLDQDYSYGQIATYFGVSWTTVSKYVKMWGFTRPGAARYHKKGITMEDARAMLESRRNGKRYTDIAKSYGITEDVARRWINKAMGAEVTAA